MVIGCCVLPLIQIFIKKSLATATGQFPVTAGEDAEQIMEANKAEMEQLGLLRIQESNGRSHEQ